MVLAIGDGHTPHEEVLISAWSTEHSLIATAMLAVGLFAVLSWDSAFPDRRDILVLAPLPVRPSTIFLAKVASLAAALSLTVISFGAAPGLVLPVALAPPSASPLDMLLSFDLYRTFAAYWITMLAAGTFILCCVLTVQGIAAQLPRQLFLRISAFLQMAAFCLFLGGYLLQPSLASPEALLAVQNQRLLAWLPSYWFLGLFQELNGSLSGAARPALISLASRAWIGLALTVTGAGTAFLLSYLLTLRRIVEEPDIVPGSRRLSRLPRVGNSLETAVVQFSIRTLFRSSQHRVILSFYSGIGAAIVILFLKTSFARTLSAASASDTWHQVSLPLLASSFVLMCFWIVGVRAVFGIPLGLQSNWIFRISELRGTAEYLRATRRATYVLALAPVWIASAVLFLSLWPWRPAAEHLVVLGLLGIILVELCLHGLHKIPFTCSYLPGKSNLHITFCLWLMLGLNLTYLSADFERRALSDPGRFASILALLCIGVIAAWWRTARANLEHTELQFEDELPPLISSLGLHRDGILSIKPSQST
jgi:hypothetical protein